MSEEIKTIVSSLNQKDSIDALANFYDTLTAKECPYHAFPPLIRNTCDHIAETQNILREFLYFCACGIVSGTVGNRYLAQGACYNFEQTPNLYFLGIGRSSSGKSLSIKIVGRQLKKLDNEAYASFVEQMKEFDESPVKGRKKEDAPCDYSFVVGNTTSEALADKMGTSGGTVFSVQEEARDLLQIVSGLYKKEGDDSGIYNLGWSCEPIQQLRVMRGRVFIPHTCLSVLWMTQPDSFISTMVDKKSASVSGFVPRFIIFKGSDEIPYDNGKQDPFDPEVIEAWDEFIKELYQERIANFEDPPIEKYASSEAKEVFRKFHNTQVSRMNKELRMMPDILGKARENAIRLALIFAIIEKSELITESIARNACEVMEYSIGNCILFFSSGLLSAIESQKNRLLEILQATNGTYPISMFRQKYGISRDSILSVVGSFPKLLRMRKKEKGNGEILELITDDSNDENSNKEITNTNETQTASLNSDDDDDLF